MGSLANYWGKSSIPDAFLQFWASKIYIQSIKDLTCIKELNIK